LRRLPKILADLAETIDRYASYFLPDILSQWFPSSQSEDRDQDSPLIYNMTAKHAVENFLKIFELCIRDFREPKFKEWRTIAKALTGARAAAEA